MSYIVALLASEEGVGGGVFYLTQPRTAIDKDQNLDDSVFLECLKKTDFSTNQS